MKHLVGRIRKKFIEAKSDPRLSKLVETFRFVDEDDYEDQGQVVRTPVSANPGLNFNPGFFFLLSKALSWIIFSNFFFYQIVGKENSTELAF